MFKRARESSRLLAVFVLFTFYTIQTSAAENEIEFKSASVSSADLTQGKSSNQLVKDLVEFVHESLEVEVPNKDVKSFLTNWVQKLNFAEIGRNAIRSYGMKNEGEMGKLMPGIMTMLLASHTIESTSMVWGTSLASHLGAGATVKWFVAAVGTVISFPGLDPLCIGLVFTYVASPHFRNVINVGTATLFKTSHFLAKISGVGPLFSLLFQKQSRLEELRTFSRDRGRLTWTDLPTDRVELETPGVLKVTVKKNGPFDAYVESVEIFDRGALQGMLEQESWMQSLGWNLKDFLKRVSRAEIRVENSEKNLQIREYFYVKNVESSEHLTRIELHPRAVGISNQFKRTSCKSWLSFNLLATRPVVC